jgi:hypothetical protein
LPLAKNFLIHDPHGRRVISLSTHQMPCRPLSPDLSTTSSLERLRFRLSLEPATGQRQRIP